MARLIVLLRGINLGPRNRISMPELREALEDAGYDDVRTYLQSGNVVLTSSASAKKVASQCERVIADRFGLEIDVVVLTRAELAKVVERNPLARVAKDPKRYQVSFLEAKPAAKTAAAIVKATTHFRDAGIIAEVSKGLGEAMPGIELGAIPERELMAPRGW